MTFEACGRDSVAPGNFDSRQNLVNCLFGKGVSSLWTIWLQPSVLKDGDRAISGVDLFRKLASLCFALDLSVTVRWIPSEISL